MTRLTRWWRGPGRHHRSSPEPVVVHAGQMPMLAPVPDVSETQPIRRYGMPYKEIA